MLVLQKLLCGIGLETQLYYQTRYQVNLNAPGDENKMKKVIIELEFRLNHPNGCCEDAVNTWILKYADDTAVDWKLRKICEESKTATVTLLFERNRSAAMFVVGPIARAEKNELLTCIDVNFFWHEELYSLLEDRQPKRVMLPSTSMSDTSLTDSSLTLRQ